LRMANGQRTLGRLRAAYNAFRNGSAPSGDTGQGRQVVLSGSQMRAMAKQHFESSETHRLNDASWVHATDRDINLYLAMQLKILRARCRYMERQDGYARGLLETWSTLVLGPNGPGLQVQCENKQFQDKLEKEWRRFADMPDAAEVDSLADWQHDPYAGATHDAAGFPLTDSFPW